MESLAQQTYAFFMTILAGGVVGFLFDAYRVVRSLLAPKQLATAMTDLLYWIVVTPTLFAMLLAGNWGELRFYVLLGLGVGLLLYFQTLSASLIWLMMSLLRGTGQLVGSTFHALARLITFPLLLIQRLFSGFAPGGSRRRVRWGRISHRPRPARLGMAWQKLSFSRLFSRFGG